MRNCRNFLIITLSLYFVICALSLHAEWAYLGLGDHKVWFIEYHNEYLYVGTDNGIYRRSMENADTLWSQIGFAGKTIEALLPLSDDTLMVGIFVMDTGSDTISIYRTIDGGANWDPYQNNYGGGIRHTILDFDRPPGQSDILFATGIGVIAKSVNGGLTWFPVAGGWDMMGVGTHFVQVDTNNINILWSGGESAIFAPVLLKSEFSGDSWTWENAEIPYTGDNACHDVAIDPFDSDICYVGMEGRVVKSIDGISFTDRYGPYDQYYVYGVEIDPLRSRIVYASGGISLGPSNLTIFKSDDSGETWTAINDGPEVSFGATDLLLLRRGAVNELYLPTYTTGVYKYGDFNEIICGDVNGNDLINILDITHLIVYLYKNGPEPFPSENADVNSSGDINILDITYLISYLYKGGPAPNCPI